MTEDGDDPFSRLHFVVGSMAAALRVAAAATFPSRTVTVIVPFAAGNPVEPE